MKNEYEGNKMKLNDMKNEYDKLHDLPFKYIKSNTNKHTCIVTS